jgi:hypothetical protein
MSNHESMKDDIISELNADYVASHNFREFFDTPSMKKVSQALSLLNEIQETQVITFYIVWAKGRASYNEDDNIDSFFLDKQECIDYVKKENNDFRSSYSHYWEEYKLKNPFRLLDITVNRES